MSTNTVAGLSGEWANPVRRAQLQENIEKLKSKEEEKTEVLFHKLASLTPERRERVDENEYPVSYCTACGTPRELEEHEEVENQGAPAASCGGSTVPSNQITPEKLLRERKIAQEIYRREHGVAPKLPSFQDSRAAKYYETRV